MLVVGFTAVLAVPLVVALVALRRPQWYPLMDLALIEMHVRDIGTANAPQTGLVGRFPVGDQRAAHPGPLGFYGLWPFYRLLGSSAYSLLAAAVAVHVLAIASLLWVASRRGRIGLLLGVSFVVALLARAYGANVLTEAWNPHLPVFWWLVFMFAVWSVLCGDLPLLPVAAAAGSFCVQTHVSYLGPVAVLGVFALAAAWHRTMRNDRWSRRALALWVAVAAGTTFVVWIPPIVDELGDGTGNLSLLWQYFTDSTNRPVGLGRGVELLLLHLNPARLLNGEIWGMYGDAGPEPAGSVVPGLLALVVWSVAAVASRRLHDSRLFALHLVVAVAVLTAVLAMSRIVGFVWYWVVLWAWGITATMLLVTVWTAGLAMSQARRQVRPRAGRGSIALAAVAATATAMVTAAFAVESASVEVVTRPSRIVGELLPSTVEALDTGSPPAAGREGRYMVAWSDPVNLGVHGYSLVSELERRGFEVGTSEEWMPQVGEHRVLSTDDATAYVHLAGGKFIETVGAQPGAEQVAYADIRTATERAEYARLRRELTERLTEAGLTDLVPLVDENIWALGHNPRVDQRVAGLANRMINIGVPYAVILLPAGAAS
jgi:hypothetical protein